jgi:RNA 2',3'-cyclic 3'-phosphodiesterase
VSPTAAAAETETRTQRLFAALPLPDNAVSDLAETVADLNIARRQSSSRPGASNRRLVAANRWHLTLAFLGEVEQVAHRARLVLQSLGGAAQPSTAEG